MYMLAVSFRQALKNLLIREAMKNAKIQAILFFHTDGP